MRSSTHPDEREGGAAALALIVTGMIIALAIVLSMVLPLTKASDAKAENRTAADAAALAGAKWIRSDLETTLTNKGWLGSWADFQPFIGTGLSSARTYAQRNDARLIEYQFNPIGWEAWAKVEGAVVRDGMRPVSEARASLDFPECHSKTKKPKPTPTPSPPPTDDDDDDDSDEPSEPPPPPPPPSMKLECGGLDLTLDPVKLGGEVLYKLPGWAISALIDMTHVKLVA